MSVCYDRVIYPEHTVVHPVEIHKRKGTELRQECCYQMNARKYSDL